MKSVLRFILLICIMCCCCGAYSQVGKLPSYYRRSINVDSLIEHTPYGLVLLREVSVYPHEQAQTRREKRRYNRLVRNFKRVYPMVLELSQVYGNIEDTLAMLDSDAVRRHYMKMREKQIMKHYRPKLVRFTLSQSVLLVKLLDRESGSTAYELIAELRGSVKAFFWQSFALLFGNDLKTNYNVHEEQQLEYLIKRYNDRTL